LPDQRWARCDLKVISLLANILARQQAVEEGCAEALLIRDGFLKEGAASNIFVVKNGVLLAPPKTQLMLPASPTISCSNWPNVTVNRWKCVKFRNGTSQRR
jgi:branched-subunit amino acid aminotransferase/4-amino-4-deoxychorismate lyase